MSAQAIVDSLLKGPVQEAEDDFISRVDSSSVDVIGAENMSVSSAHVSVVWAAEPEYRSWGIKDITPIVRKVDGFIELETIEDEPQYQQVDLAGFAVDGTIEAPPSEARRSLSLYPVGVEINLKNRSILVKF